MKSCNLLEVRAKSRPFYDFYVSLKSRLAFMPSKPRSGEHRRRIRQDESRPIVDALHVWLEDHVARISASSDLSNAIHHVIRH